MTPPHDPETGEIIEPGSPPASPQRHQAATTAPSEESHAPTDGAVPDDATVALRDEAREAASRGRATFATLWQRLSLEQRRSLAPVMDELGRLTREADALRAEAKQ
jgi:hypothetical protein